MNPRIRLRPPILGGVIRGPKAEFRPESADLIKAANTGGVIRGFKAEFGPKFTDLVKTASIARRYPRIQCGIPP